MISPSGEMIFHATRQIAVPGKSFEPTPFDFTMPLFGRSKFCVTRTGPNPAMSISPPCMKMCRYISLRPSPSKSVPGLRCMSTIPFLTLSGKSSTTPSTLSRHEHNALEQLRAAHRREVLVEPPDDLRVALVRVAIVGKGVD